MNVKPTLELVDEDFNGLYDLLGSAWRENSQVSEHYQRLAELMKERTTTLAQRAFALGVEVGSRTKNL